MIRKFQVKNYKNFKQPICIDFTKVHDYQYNEFCVNNDLISKMIIYGKNAEGKSNFGSALFDIAYDIKLGKNPFYYRNEQKMYKNADAKDDELIEFMYSFKFDNDILDYEYKKKDVYETVFEKLVINGKVIFYYDIQSGEQDFTNIELINAKELNWQEFFETENREEMRPTALRYIIYNTVQKGTSIINKLSQFIKNMWFMNSINNYNLRFSFDVDNYFEGEEDLRKFENFLNEYGVKCKLIMLEQPDGKKEIYFNHNKPLLFSSNMSSGTFALTRFYLQYLNKNKPSFLFMDEYDAYYHFELSEKIVKLLENEFEGQVILTTHNTSLLSNSIMRPDCFLILSNGKLTSICEATNRELRQGHNLEKLYKNGEFDE